MDVALKDALASISPVEDDSAPHGAFDVILSTPARDRDGEEVKSTEWQTPLPDHVTFDVDHGMSVSSTVGSGRPEIQADGSLRVRGTFASTPLAQQTRALVKEGHIRTTSVAFLRKATTDRKDGTPRVTRELLNGAFVAVPANPEAVILSSKAAVKAGARNSAADAKSIQAIHDQAAALGAACPDPSMGDGDQTKTVRVVRKDADDDPGELAQAVDAALDEAMPLLAAVDPTTLPEPVQQAIGLIQAAGAAVDTLLQVLGIPDPDDDDSEDESQSASPGAAAAAPGDADDDLATRALRLRALSNRYGR